MVSGLTRSWHRTPVDPASLHAIVTATGFVARVRESPEGHETAMGA